MNFDTRPSRVARLAKTAPALLVALALSTGCPERPPPCLPCPAVGGTYVVESTTTFGDCDFLPMLVDAEITIEQMPDDEGSDASALVVDPVLSTGFQLTGEILEPAARDPEATITRLELSSETTRQAGPLDNRLVTLLVLLDGTIEEVDDGLRLTGALTSTDISPPALDEEELEPGCSISINFTALLPTE